MKKQLGTIIAVTALMGMYAAAHHHQTEHPEIELASLCGGGPVATACGAGNVDKEAVCTGEPDCPVCLVKGAEADKEAVCTREPDCPVGAKKSEGGSRPWWQFWKR